MTLHFDFYSILIPSIIYWCLHAYTNMHRWKHVCVSGSGGGRDKLLPATGAEPWFNAAMYEGSIFRGLHNTRTYMRIWGKNLARKKAFLCERKFSIPLVFVAGKLGIWLLMSENVNKGGRGYQSHSPPLDSDVRSDG